MPSQDTDCNQNHHQPPPRRCESSLRGRRRRRCRRRRCSTGGLHVRQNTATCIFGALLVASHAQCTQGTTGTTTTTSSSSRGFDPYALNGGLVAAVAGPDYCILAADTRLADGGYQIQSRRYLDGRIWAATQGLHDHDHDGHSDDGGGQRALFELDGSLRIPAEESAVPVTAAPKEVPSTADASNDGDNHGDSSRPTARRWVDNPFGVTLVGSAGCASDCEQLKRTVRTELADRCSWARPSILASTLSATPPPTTTTTASTVATLLLHTLYSRRPFPYYSFCVLAGLDADTGTGQVHVYDAIGSHERVAVACAGTSREMLQPILDRVFTSTSRTSAASSLPPHRKLLHGDDVDREHGRSTASTGGGGNGINRLVRDGTALEAEGQRTGTLSLRPPVGTHVNCGADEAVALLVKAYRSVSEREIGVGDDLVVCVLRRNARRSTQDDADRTHDAERGYVEVMRFPLKKH